MLETEGGRKSVCSYISKVQVLLKDPVTDEMQQSPNKPNKPHEDRDTPAQMALKDSICVAIRRGWAVAICRATTMAPGASSASCRNVMTMRTESTQVFRCKRRCVAQSIHIHIHIFIYVC